MNTPTFDSDSHVRSTKLSKRDFLSKQRLSAVHKRFAERLDSTKLKSPSDPSAASFYGISLPDLLLALDQNFDQIPFHLRSKVSSLSNVAKVWTASH